MVLISLTPNSSLSTIKIQKAPSLQIFALSVPLQGKSLKGIWYCGARYVCCQWVRPPLSGAYSLQLWTRDIFSIELVYLSYSKHQKKFAAFAIKGFFFVLSKTNSLALCWGESNIPKLESTIVVTSGMFWREKKEIYINI